MKTFYAVEWKGEIIAVFLSYFDASDYASARTDALVHSWLLPAETFQFEGEKE